MDEITRPFKIIPDYTHYKVVVKLFQLSKKAIVNCLSLDY